MRIELLGTAAAQGWPEPRCRCASCGLLRAAGAEVAPLRVLVDGVPLNKCSQWAVPGGHDVQAPGGERLLVSGGPGQAPEPLADVAYHAVLLDLVGRPEQLGHLRAAGAVTEQTEVHAVHVDHRITGPAELERRMGWWRRPRQGTHRTLLLGGTRSGKSAEAELRLLGHAAVAYVATGPAPDAAQDRPWADRVRAHQVRRPSWWRTVETTDLAGVLGSASGALLVDGIGTWLAAVMDETNAWEDPAALRPHVDELVAAWRSTEACVVAVSEEVGLSVVSATAAGRAFADALGHLNQRLAAESEETALVVAGRVMELR